MAMIVAASDVHV